jgi:hypothetical protein
LQARVGQIIGSGLGIGAPAATLARTRPQRSAS